MSYVVSGASSDKLGIETGFAARVMGYGREGPVADAFGHSPSELARGSVVFNWPVAGGTAVTDGILFAIRNSSSSRKLFIHQIYLQGYADVGGTGANIRLTFRKYKNVTSISGAGAVTLTPSIFKTALGQATGVDAKASNGTTLLTLNDSMDAGRIASIRSNGCSPSATFDATTTQFRELQDQSIIWNEAVQLVQNEAVALISDFTLVPGNTPLWGTLFLTEHAL